MDQDQLDGDQDARDQADRAEIEALKYRYVRFLDLKAWDDLGETLTEDCVADYADGSLHFEGREAVLGFLRESLGTPERITVHRVGHPELTRTGPDAFEGTWALDDVVLLLDAGLTLRGAAYYADRYERRDGRWRIAATGYRRVYEEMERRAPAPELTLTSTWWSPGHPGDPDGHAGDGGGGAQRPG
jgi:hypothetical protein